jgi:hypothetical protein
MSFLSELSQKRSTPGTGGNPNRFVELAGATEVPMTFIEPDPNTARLSYYYNTRLNVLFKNIKAKNPITGKTKRHWQPVSQCT